MPECLAEQVGAPNAGPRIPLWCVGFGCRGSLRVDECQRQIDIRDPVTQRMVRLDDERDIARCQAVNEPHLPQRTASVEWQRLEPTHQGTELIVGPRLRERRQPNVKVEIEVCVVDPDRSTLAERNLLDVLSESGNAVKPPADMRAQSVDVDVPAVTAKWCTFEDRE
jgi:hypothetical protein